MLLLSLIITCVTIVNLKLGLSMWFIVSPLMPIISSQIESIPLLINPALAVGISLNLVLRKQKLKLRVSVLLFFAYILFSTLLVTMFYQHYTSFNAVINFVLVIFITYIITVAYYTYEDIYNNIAFSLLLSGLVVFMLALSDLGEASRLAVEDSVRQLANVLGFSSIFILLTLFSQGKVMNVLYKRSLIVCLIPMIIALIFTVSRGAIMAFFMTLICSYFFSLYQSKSIKAILLRLPKVMAWGGGIFFLLYYYISTKFEMFIFIIEKRFQADEIGSGTGIRQEIWSRVLESYSLMELFLGLGIGGFVHRSTKIGVFYYSHSVFVDILATSGIIVLIVVLALLLRVLLKSFYTNNVFSFGIVIYACLNFATHGSITSPIFWICIAFAIGASIKHKNSLQAHILSTRIIGSNLKDN